MPIHAQSLSPLCISTSPFLGAPVVAREAERHVLAVLQLGHELGHDAFAGDGPAHLVPDRRVQDLAVQLRLRLDSQHSQRGRHVQILGNPAGGGNGGK